MLMRLLPPAALACLACAAILPCRAATDDAATGQPAYQVETGVLDGAQFAIAVPTPNWNRKLLLLAHGYRPENAPLIPDLRPDRASLLPLIKDGWMVATTSYRRNGMIIGDAIADIDALRAFIAQEHGDPERVILEGESMGGLIVTLIAERDKGPYDGAIAFDATLYAKEMNGQVGISLLPRIPLLFVATLREATQAKGYLTTLISRPSPVIPPALFLINREGHTNINQAEHIAAFEAMSAWIDRGPDSLPEPKDQAPYFDATVPPEPGPSTATIHADQHALETHVAEVDAVYGNVLLDAQAQDFAAAGIPPMTYCTLQVGAKSYRTLYGRTYSDVKKDEWVAFPDADGRTVLARSFDDAVKAAGLGVGTPLTLAAVAPGAVPSP